MSAPAVAPPPVLPRRDGVSGRDFDEVEHLVNPDTDPDVSLCGVDQKGVPWNQWWLPKCQACIAIARGGMN